MYIGTYLQEQSIKYEYYHQITSQAAEFKGQGHLKKDKSCDLFLALNLITGNSDRPQFLFMGQQARRNLWEQWAFNASYFFIYRGSLPNATFVSGKNSHQPKFALAKYLPYANFWLFYFISAILWLFLSKRLH